MRTHLTLRVASSKTSSITCKMRQIIRRRNDHHSISRCFWKVPEISRHEPRPCSMGKRQKRDISEVGARKGPIIRVRKLQALFNQIFQPKRREIVAAEFGSLDHLSALGRNSRAGCNMHLPTQYPIRDDLSRRPGRSQAGRDDYVGIQNN